jgi:3-oxoacyl-[acyl-carrier-protein] synthase II
MTKKADSVSPATCRDRRRVVITGMGALTPVGLNVEACWENIVAGRSGVQFELLAAENGFASQIAGRVHDFHPEEWLPAREARRMPRFAQLALVAAIQAVCDANLEMSATDLTRVGVILGTAFGGAMDETQEAARIYYERGPLRISPFYMVRMLPNIASHHISCYFDTAGYINTIVAACASGTQAIGEAAEVIRRGAADVVIAGGSESQTGGVALASMSVMGGLSTRNHEPARASRPFERNRDGVVGSEGAGVVVLESLEHAQRRGARVHAEILGFAAASDTSHITHPDPDGCAAARAMQWALADARLRPEQINLISAHATSTLLGDAAETKAIKLVFGDAAYHIPVNAAKSMTGHMSGASGAFETILCVKSIQTGVLHPTINYDEPDPECDLDYVPNVARHAEVQYALKNSFGFGGQNSCLILGRFFEQM